MFPIIHNYIHMNAFNTLMPKAKKFLSNFMPPSGCHLDPFFSSSLDSPYSDMFTLKQIHAHRYNHLNTSENAFDLMKKKREEMMLNAHGRIEFQV